MDYDHSPEVDLWIEFGNEDTAIERKVELLWNLGNKESHKYGSGDPLKYWISALEIAKDNELTGQAATICRDLASHHISVLRDYETGLHYADEGLSLQPEHLFSRDELSDQAHMTWGKAVALVNLGRLDEALYNYSSGSAMYSDLSQDFLAHALATSAVFCHIELEQFDQAEKLIPDLRTYFQSEDNLDKVAYLDSLQAYVLLSQNREEEALALLIEAKSVLKQANTVDPEFLCRLAFGYYRNLEYETALKTYDRGLLVAMAKGPDDYIYAIKANLGRAEVFEALGKPKKASKARFDAEVIRTRKATAMAPNSEKNFLELEKLRKRGDYQLAVQLGAQIVKEQEEAGNNDLKLRAQCEILATLFLNNQHQEVLELWSSLPQLEIDQDDALSVKIKNMVVHSMYRCNMVNQAKELCYQVIGDVRLQAKIQEHAYAYENLSEIEEDPTLRMQHQSVAIESNLQADNPARALRITRKLRDEY
jgi:tetratricopeptide (TPR) repeat protein